MFESLEKFVMSKLFARLFDASADNRETNRALIQKVDVLAEFIEAKHLEIPEVYWDQSNWKRAMQELLNIDNFKSPRDKIVCLLNCCRIIINVVKKVKAMEFNKKRQSELPRSHDNGDGDGDGGGDNNSIDNDNGHDNESGENDVVNSNDDVADEGNDGFEPGLSRAQLAEEGDDKGDSDVISVQNINGDNDSSHDDDSSKSNGTVKRGKLDIFQYGNDSDNDAHEDNVSQGAPAPGKKEEEEDPSLSALSSFFSSPTPDSAEGLEKETSKPNSDCSSDSDSDSYSERETATGKEENKREKSGDDNSHGDNNSNNSHRDNSSSSNDNVNIDGSDNSGSNSDSSNRDTSDRGINRPSGPSADDFLPILIYVIIKAQPANLHLNIEYIQACRNPNKLSGEPAYFFTHLVSAVTFIQYLTAKDLNIDAEEYDVLYAQGEESVRMKQQEDRERREKEEKEKAERQEREEREERERIQAEQEKQAAGTSMSSSSLSRLSSISTSTSTHIAMTAGAEEPLPGSSHSLSDSFTREVASPSKRSRGHSQGGESISTSGLHPAKPSLNSVSISQQQEIQSTPNNHHLSFRFESMRVDDLKLGDVGPLLYEYQKMARIIRQMQKE